MNRRRYSEDQSVQKPAAQLLASMGCRSAVAFHDEDFGPHSLLGRSNKSNGCSNTTCAQHWCA